jgi:formylglycine-generating enzyme
VLRRLAAPALALASAGCLVGIDLSLLDGGTVRRDGDVEPPACPGDTIDTPIAGRLCVDRTEVSRASYAVFLGGAPNPEGTGLGNTCRWNTTLDPAFDWPAPGGTEAWPVVGVDWCDARVYCQAQGKRLCTETEWFEACSRSGARSFPYEGAFVSGRCNGAGGTGTPVAIGSLGQCTGGFDGLFDLSGNVAEWVDDCDNQMNPQNHLCAFRGGSYLSDGDQLSCGAASRASDRRSSSAADRGFRCCLTP